MCPEPLSDGLNAESRPNSSRPSAAAPGSHGNPLTGQPTTLDSLEFVMDVPVEVSVEIGRKKMKIAEILRVGPGAVLELDKAAGEPLDIYVNNRVIARGEAVVIGDHYGVRLTEILFQDDGRGRGSEGR